MRRGIRAPRQGRSEERKRLGGRVEKIVAGCPADARPDTPDSSPERRTTSAWAEPPVPPPAPMIVPCPVSNCDGMHSGVFYDRTRIAPGVPLFRGLRRGETRAAQVGLFAAAMLRPSRVVVSAAFLVRTAMYLQRVPLLWESNWWAVVVDLMPRRPPRCAPQRTAHTVRALHSSPRRIQPWLH